MSKYFQNLNEKSTQLLANIKMKLPELIDLLNKVNSHWNYEDPIYRFYHRSFKVYRLQSTTKEIVEMLRSLSPENTSFSVFFEEIIKEGVSEKKFDESHNPNWPYHTRPFVEAFFHAKFFLEMAVKYSKELEEIPTTLPSGWAALLCLYNMR